MLDISRKLVSKIQCTKGTIVVEFEDCVAHVLLSVV